MLFLFCIMVGLLISIQSRIIKGSFLYISPKVIQEYQTSIKSEEAEKEQISELIENKESQLREYHAMTGESDGISFSMKEELEMLKLLSGFTDVQGEGVVVILDDGTRELLEGEEPGDVIVHDMDILKIINDLKVAGAEAVSVNGQRVISSTEINCSGHSVRINNQFFAQPFIIKAIGDPKMLESALTAPTTYGALLRDYYGLILNVDKSINIKIKKYGEEVDYKYLKNLEEGEVS